MIQAEQDSLRNAKEVSEQRYDDPVTECTLALKDKTQVAGRCKILMAEATEAEQVVARTLNELY